MKQDEKGFTLIELLIVIIILGILAVIGIPKFLNSKKDAWAGVCRTNRASLEDAGERYQFDVNAYPDDQEDLLYDNDSEDAPSGYNGPYIKRAFVCPADPDAEDDPYSFNDDGEVSCTNTTIAEGASEALHEE